MHSGLATLQITNSSVLPSSSQRNTETRSLPIVESSDDVTDDDATSVCCVSTKSAVNIFIVVGVDVVNVDGQL